jgi:hypothetical protein
MSFGYNELKVLKSFCEEFQEEKFEIYKSNNLFCLKVWFGISSFESLTSSLSISFIPEENLRSNNNLYIIFNIDKDNELQLNFKKSIVEGDRTFDIIKKFTKKDKQLKSIKLLLQLINDKKLFKKDFETLSKEKAIDLSRESHGIFQDQKNKKDVEKIEKIEKIIIAENIEFVENKEKEENKDDKDKDDISLDELSEVAVKELFVLLSYKLGNIKKMVEKKVVDAMSKSMYKYIIKQVINITLQISGVEDKKLVNEMLSKCKTLGCFNKTNKKSHVSSDVKRSTNPYIEFSKKMRPQIKRDNPNMKGTEIVQLIAKLWNQKKGE